MLNTEEETFNDDSSFFIEEEPMTFRDEVVFDFETVRVGRCPCKNLIASTIIRAILDLKNEKEFKTAHAWIFSPSVSEWSFFWCLTELGIEGNVEKIRSLCTEMMETMKEEGPQKKVRPTRDLDIFKLFYE